MPNQKLGVTANELFACNPFRILGLPVTAEDDVITSTYQKLLSMAGTPDADNYTTDYDFPSLPPFKRDEATLRTAYAKLASNGYRCFAYSGGEYSQSLTVDDITLNISDLSNYDVFLRCYMWLVVNDRNFEQPHLWVPLAKHIDKLIGVQPNELNKYFGTRFPSSAVRSGGEQLLNELHATFKDIILLPLKELVRGSMRCTSAIQILQAAKVNTNAKPTGAKIPQSNRTAPGGLKLAVKSGEEYFDDDQGKMVNYDQAGEHKAAVESHTFAAAASSISAESIFSDEPVKPAARRSPAMPANQAPPLANKSKNRVSLVDDHIAAQAAQSSGQQSSQQSNRTSLVEEEVPVKHVDAIDTLAPKKRGKANIEKNTGETQKATAFTIPNSNTRKSVNIVNTSPDEYNKPKEKTNGAVHYVPGEDDLPSASIGTRTLEAVNPFASSSEGYTAGYKNDETAVIANNKRKTVNFTGLDYTDEGMGDMVDQIQFTRPEGYVPEEEDDYDETEEGLVKSNRTLVNLIEEVDAKTEETTEQLLTEQEEEDALYTDTLIKLLRQNRSNKMMKDVDTFHEFKNGGGTEGSSKTKNITMDDINMNRYDKTLLNSAYGTKRVDDSTKEKAAQAIKDKYKKLDIDDMINPTMGKKYSGEYHEDVFKEYVKNKETEKKVSLTIAKSLVIILLVACLVAFLIFATNG